MNIEEAKQKLHNMAYRDLQTKPYDLKFADVIQMLNQIKLDQPKPEVPRFVADWVDYSRERHYDFDEWFDCDNQPMEVYKWLNPKNRRCAGKNALALITLIVNGPDAVTVEKEKLYTVEIPNPNDKEIALRLEKWVGGKVIIIATYSSNNFTDDMRLTEQEIRKDFDWAWREGFAEEVTE